MLSRTNYKYNKYRSSIGGHEIRWEDEGLLCWQDDLPPNGVVSMQPAQGHMGYETPELPTGRET